MNLLKKNPTQLIRRERHHKILDIIIQIMKMLLVCAATALLLMNFMTIPTAALNTTPTPCKSFPKFFGGNTGDT